MPIRIAYVCEQAHPREDRKRGRMVGWTWAAPMVGSTLAVTVYEWETRGGALLVTTQVELPTPIAPHDFALTDNWYVFVLNAMELRLAPFILGLTGPVGALRTTGEGVTLQLVPRPGGNAAHRSPITVTTDDPYFAIHHATAFEEAAPAEAGSAAVPSAPPVLRVLTAAWPRVGAGPFLGDWGGDVPVYDDGKINPTQLLLSTITLSEVHALHSRSRALPPLAVPSPLRLPIVVTIGMCIRRRGRPSRQPSSGAPSWAARV